MCAAIVKHYNKINTSVSLSKIKHVCCWRQKSWKTRQEISHEHMFPLLLPSLIWIWSETYHFNMHFYAFSIETDYITIWMAKCHWLAWILQGNISEAIYIGNDHIQGRNHITGNRSITFMITLAVSEGQMICYHRVWGTNNKYLVLLMTTVTWNGFYNYERFSF